MSATKPRSRLTFGRPKPFHLTMYLKNKILEFKNPARNRGVARIMGATERSFQRASPNLDTPALRCGRLPDEPEDPPAKGCHK